jgi:UTP--glucose-1-phosphate uridylyltransferase
MRVRKAVITAAGPGQRRLPLQTLIDRDGVESNVLSLMLYRMVLAGTEEICVVIAPGDEEVYRSAAGEHAGRVRFVEQAEPRGYGHAIYCAREFVAGQPFLHQMSDHIYVNGAAPTCSRQLIEDAEAEGCSISAVQETREGLLPRFGAIGGQQLPGSPELYKVDTVMEKPTPTQAEQELIVPGLRAGHYLCFFGLHVLTPMVMTILGELLEQNPGERISLSGALAELVHREKYLAKKMTARRVDLGAPYGPFVAQLLLAMTGRDKTEVLSQIVEAMTIREAASVWPSPGPSLQPSMAPTSMAPSMAPSLERTVEYTR